MSDSLNSKNTTGDDKMAQLEALEALQFSTTSEMHDWLHSTKIDGPCVIRDGWTYGLLLVFPGGGWRTLSAAEREQASEAFREMRAERAALRIDTRCNCEFLGCEHRAGGCSTAPEILAEIFGIKVTLCFRCYLRQTVSLAPNEFRILNSK